MEIDVRVMRKADAPAIKQLEIACGLSPWSERDYRDEAEREDSCCLVATRAGSGEIVGFLISRLVQGSCELNNIAVHPDWRRMGVASLLLERLFSEVSHSNAARILLEVRAGNVGARAFYTLMGFAEQGLRKGFYSGPTEDAILLQRIVE